MKCLSLFRSDLLKPEPDWELPAKECRTRSEDEGGKEMKRFENDIKTRRKEGEFDGLERRGTTVELWQRERKQWAHTVIYLRHWPVKFSVWC